jgi:transcriptional regulator GlxA family with amidase domain
MDLSAPSNFGADASRVVAIVAFDAARALDVAGAMEVFSGANTELDRSAYVVQVLFVPGATGQDPVQWPRLTDLVATIARQADRVVVPDGYPGLPTHMQSASIIYTAPTAAMYVDLSLAVVRDDHGDEIATRVAARTSQAARLRPAFPSSVDPRIQPLLAWIVQDPRREFSAELLASQAAMSVRTLSRLFIREMGITPSKFVEKIRVGLARDLLNNSRLSLAAIAVQSGFGSEERMRRAFRRAYGASPRALLNS